MNAIKEQICIEVSKLSNKELDVVLQNTDKSLFSKPFNLSSEELLYLYFLVKERYNKNFDKKKLVYGGFISIDNITSLISI